MDQSLGQYKFKVHTFGCKVNTYDTGLIQKNLSGAGFSFAKGKVNEDFDKSESRIHILNTCAVTAEATKEAVRQIRRIKAKDPLCTVVVTGCAAQVDTDSFAELKAADLIVANSHKASLPEILNDYYKGKLTERVFKSNIFRKEDLESGGGEEQQHTRSFLKIQDGCNSFCTYCIIPFARGKSRSIPRRELANRIQNLYESGVRETVLTGVHIGDYDDESKGLEDLLEYLLKHTKMPRFRLSSLEPVELSDRLIDLYQDERMCPHFHMSIQSANDVVLAGMKRKYGQKEVIASLEKIKSKVPNAFVGMDVIVGFPNETEEFFIDTYQALLNSPWSRIHVFPYSERKGTKATVMPDSVVWDERLRRASRLRELSLNRFTEQAKAQVGSLKEVLVLKKPARGSDGVSRDYWNIKIDGDESIINNWRGQEILTRITKYVPDTTNGMEGHLLAEVMS